MNHECSTGFGESYLDVRLEASRKLPGFVHYDSRVRCALKAIITKIHKLGFLTSASSTSIVVVLFEGLYNEIPWALCCSNCLKSAALGLGVLTSLRTPVMLGQRLM